MKAILTRNNYHPLQTTGSFQLLDDDQNEIFCCDTLELPWKENKNRISCIPTGNYKATFRTVGAYANRAFHIQEQDGKEVNGRSHILIHSGNFFTDTKGCVLLGRGYADLELKTKSKNISKDGILDLLNSGKTISELIGLVCDFDLEIITSQKESTSEEEEEIYIKEGDLVIVDVSSSLNLRTSTSAKSRIIERLKKGTKLKVIAIKEEWSKVETQGIEGWVAKKYISLEGEYPAVKIKSGYLNIREEGQASAVKVLDQGLNNLEKVEILEEKNDWLRVRCRVLSGFVHNEYLRKGI
ncbi:DUF5675 family protein [Flammeovirga pacifica]|uniref:SH3b domain-containing protein n=1 Tax=Flammeovirga pacifica TaxID=915059 RepID=A0A1S1Z4F9_FLAPC|nr:DUF5675 family protein [Flammeovirga pacifica]OHX68043.1 hypothetical protein NH26_17685 [Flammeovirga pacifica]